MTLISEHRLEVGRTPSPGEKKVSTPWTVQRLIMWTVGIVFVAVALYSIYDIGVNPLTLYFERDDIGNLLSRMWPPTIQEIGPV